MPAPVYQNRATEAVFSAGSVRSTLPSGASPDDGLVFVVGWFPSDTSTFPALDISPAAPAGWKKLGFVAAETPGFGVPIAVAAYARVVESGDPTNVSFALSGSIGFAQCYTLRFTGVAADVDDAFPLGAGSGEFTLDEIDFDRIVFPSITSTADDALRFGVYMSDSEFIANDPVPPSGWEEAYFDNRSLAAWMVEQAVAGSSGQALGTTPGSSRPRVGFNFFVQPQTVGGNQLIEPSGIASTAEVGEPTVTLGAVSIVPEGIASGAQIGLPIVTLGAVAVAPTGIASTAQFGQPTLAIGVVEVAPAGIAPTTQFGEPEVTRGAVAVAPEGIAPGTSFGVPNVLPGAVEISPAGIASGTEFGEPEVTRGAVTVSPDGVASVAAFGVPTIVPGAVEIAPTGIAPTTAFGSPSVHQRLFAESIPPAAEFGEPEITRGAVAIAPAGIAPTTTFGTPAVFGGGVTVHPDGIAPTTAFGVPTVARGRVDLRPGGIPSLAALGVPAISRGRVELRPTGIPSHVAFGVPTVFDVAEANTRKWQIGADVSEPLLVESDVTAGFDIANDNYPALLIDVTVDAIA